MKPFVDETPHTANGGDVLYLPPGVPHWGVATDFCMTWSIGMRAPNLAELKAGAARMLDTKHQQALDTVAIDTAIFYEDPDLRPDEAQSGFISDAAVRRAKNILQDLVSLDDRAIATVLGCVVTDPKAWLEPETMSDDRARAFMNTVDKNRKLDVHGMARIAFCINGGSVQLFVNGHSREFSRACVESIRRICRDRCATPAQLGAGDDPGLLRWLLTRGAINLTKDDH